MNQMKRCLKLRPGTSVLWVIEIGNQLYFWVWVLGLVSELFYPTCRDVVQTDSACSELASVAASVFRIEFRDKRKATAAYLSDIKGARSMDKISDAEKLAGRGVAASNSISESVHATSTWLLQLFGTIDIQHCAAGGQTRSNNDFGRDHDNFVQGRKRKKEKKTRGVGGFHKLVPELQYTAMLTSKEERKNNKKQFQAYLKCQFDKRRIKEEVAMQKKLDMAQEDYMEAVLLYDQYHSERCWLTGRVAREVYSQLKSESARLAAVKVNVI